MKKILSLLLAFLLLLGAGSAWAEAAEVYQPFTEPPIRPIAAPTEIYAAWQLYTDGEPPQWQMTALADAKDFVITLRGLEAWGIGPEDWICRRYDPDAGQWLPDDTAPAPEGDTAVLRIDARYYYMNGLPGWQVQSADDTCSYVLQNNSGDPNNPDYYLLCTRGDTMAEIALTKGGFALRSYGENDMSYCVYDPASLLTMGVYMCQSEDGTLASYALTPDDAGAYELYYINVQTPDGGNLLWTEGAWQNIHGEEAAAPKGYSPEELPFALIRE